MDENDFINFLKADTEIIQQQIDEFGVEVEDICADCIHEGYWCALTGFFFGYKGTHCNHFLLHPLTSNKK